MHNLSKAQLKQIIDSRKDALIINVLPQESFRERHIPGSINIPFKDGSFASEVEQRATSKDKYIVVYCASTDCNLSQRAMNTLKDAGFTNVHTYEEGVKGWFGEESTHAAA